MLWRGTARTTTGDRLPCFARCPGDPAAGTSSSFWRCYNLGILSDAEDPEGGIASREADMNPIPGNTQALRDDSAIRRAAILVIDEFGESAAEYAVTRAMVLQRQGDEIGASTWRRVAPVIEELQRKKSAGSN